MGLGLPTGAAGSRFDATKRHIDSSALRPQGRVIPLTSQKATSGPPRPPLVSFRVCRDTDAIVRPL